MQYAIGMRLSRALALLMLAAMPLCSPAQAPSANDACLGFKWDISQERALFRSAPRAVEAGTSRVAAPGLEARHLYEVRLAPAEGVSFPVAPGKASPAQNTYAGIIALDLRAAGNYRVAVDTPLWIDIAAHGRLVPASDYEGQRSCSAPRKIVQFALAGSRHWIVQLSGSSVPIVRLAITPVPAS